ncbi:NAD(P)H-dependent glycerol-3-phosphate dehydrogenase [Mycoplasmopsis alligatoris]|uniref:Glycerol-3-phosphate dehydrogenase n=1 Tax=Mycoplasmopsis alligatoris A21JP2 TaxID=747682 RepID=D4XWS8_9BACT|nr:NAD(P)H-dependent glycerol-3-phosphate dehydrogenase [Mycoplasmopsis alligatoris]EFF41330.1 NAD-dependent glycerol-3-phosphate dehydrogenase N-terminal domain protein [Mycoplasmopsis alligatoris A21JP2]
MHKSKICFIGTGAWGSALASVVSKNEHSVSMYGINKDEINDINKGKNTKYFGNKNFNNPENIVASNNLKECLKDADVVVLAVPSPAIKQVIKEIQQELKTKKIDLINVVKGIDEDTELLFSELIQKKFKRNLSNFATLIGPSFATEVFEDVLTMINVVGSDINYLAKVTRIFNNDTFRLVINEDEKASEIFAALKNVLAIGLGMINYFSPNKNTHAAILSIGVKEIHSVYKALYPQSKDTIGYELAGIGDIFLTCSSPKSRNYSFGYSIAEHGIKKILEKEQKTIEGYYTAKILSKIIEKNDLNVPFLKSIIDVLFNKKNPFKVLDFVEEYN